MSNLNKQKASIGERFVAQTIDSILPLAFGLLLINIGNHLNIPDIYCLTFALILGIAIMLTWDALPNGQSLGKKVVKISAIDVETGNPCSLIQSIVRNIILILPIIGYVDIAFAFSKSGRRLGDRIAKTVVVRLESDLEKFQKISDLNNSK